jgi:hypothetical protein
MRYPIIASAFFVALAIGARANAQATVAVDPSADAHPISPLIYGANFTRSTADAPPR